MSGKISSESIILFFTSLTDAKTAEVKLAIEEAQKGNWLHMGVLLLMLSDQANKNLESVSLSTFTILNKHLIARGVEPRICTDVVSSEEFIRDLEREFSLITGIKKKEELPPLTTWNPSSPESKNN